MSVNNYIKNEPIKDYMIKTPLVREYSKNFVVLKLISFGTFHSIIFIYLTGLRGNMGIIFFQPFILNCEF